MIRIIVILFFTFFVFPFGVASGQSQKLAIFNVKDFGATGKKVPSAQAAIQKAIDACAAAGGGMVYLPPGEYSSGKLILKSHVRLHIEAGATLYSIKDKSAFGNGPQKEALLFADGAENISIEGLATVNGQGQYEWRLNDIEDDFIRPNLDQMVAQGKPLLRSFPKKDQFGKLVLLLRCKDVRITGLSFIDSPSWTIHPYACERLTIDGIYIRSSLKDGVWADGIDPDGCKDVRINNCTIETGDDALVFYSMNWYGPALPCENITVTNCRFTSSSSAIKFCDGNMNAIRHVTIDNCVIRSSNRGITFINFDGGEVSDVVLSNLTVECVRNDWFWWGDGDPLHFNIKRRSEVHKSIKPEDYTNPAGKIRRVERGQVLADQRPDRAQEPRPGLEHARPHAGDQLLRARRGPLPRRPARLRLCRGAGGGRRPLAGPSQGLSLRPGDAAPRLRADRHAPRHQGGGRGNPDPARPRRRAVPDRADQGRQGEGRGPGAGAGAGPRRAPEAPRRLPRACRHLLGKGRRDRDAPRHRRGARIDPASSLPKYPGQLKERSIRRAVNNQNNIWTPIAMNDAVCLGDMIRSRTKSRAGLRLVNNSMLRWDQRSSMTLLLEEDKNKSFLMNLLEGAIHIITRTPKPFDVKTPFINASVHGTEFLVRATPENGQVVVYEGKVTTSNDFGNVVLNDREVATAQLYQAPQKSINVHPTDAVRWALHYPTITSYWQFDSSDASQMIQRASDLLAVGQADDAQSIIAQGSP